eukprot:CAMPEP_0116871726 /NCGR_PEP_ID=MMETSP0463-20121206/2210_1 /TAXON_ID=181622 /ORGANISM="Strombidinopsis sp, Strain SopsisLIS2011" /LENGTH=73 /DNA_ID=CAMNT_0004510703 /DNA_START=718 /DNA_END=939 /DNA_ORIENTATION=+
MDERIRENLTDFMNLVFGASEERDDFWNDILLRETSEYFNYPYEDLTKHEMKLNALYFAVIDVTGLKVIGVDL